LSPSDAFDARLFDGKSHADANRSGAEHLDLQIKDAEHLVERRTGISICLVLCNVSTHVIYIYIYIRIRGRNVQRVSSRHGHAWTLILAPSLSHADLFLMLIHVYLNC